MAPKREVAIHLKAIDEASKVFNNVANNALPNLAKRVAQLGTAFASFETLRFVAKQALDAEKATAALTAALDSQKLSVSSHLPHLTAFAGALSRVTSATDEEILSAQKIGIQLGRLTGESLDRATKAALDLAAGLGIDLNSAMERIAKVAAGNVREWTRMGVKFQENATDAEKLNVVLGFIDQRFGGAAQAQVRTMAGELGQLAKAFGELAEAAGKSATGAGPKEAIGTITSAVNAITQHVNTKGGASAIHQIVPLPGDPIWTSINKINELADAIERLKMDDAVMLALSGKFAETADPVLQQYVKDLDAIIQGQDEAAESAKKFAEALARIKANIAVEVFAPQQPQPKPSIATGSVPGTITGIAESAANVAAVSAADLEAQTAGVEAQAEAWEDMIRIIAEAQGGLIQYGEHIDLVATKTTAWTTELEATLSGALASAAGQLGQLMVDAAFGADIAWDKAIKSIIAGLIAAVIQAVILKAIQTALTGGYGAALSAGGVAGESFSAGSTSYAAGGMFTPRGTDVVPAMLTPGEIVLPRGVSHDILNGRASVVPAGGAGGGRPQVVTVQLGGATLTRLLVDNARSVVEVLDHIDARGM